MVFTRYKEYHSEKGGTKGHTQSWCTLFDYFYETSNLFAYILTSVVSSVYKACALNLLYYTVFEDSNHTEIHNWSNTVFQTKIKWYVNETLQWWNEEENDFFHKIIHFAFFHWRGHTFEKCFNIENPHFLKESLLTLLICEIPHGAVERNHHRFYQFHEKVTKLCYTFLILTSLILGVEGRNWSILYS